MGRGAGQLMLVDGLDMGLDLTSVNENFSKTLFDRTALNDDARRRVGGGTRDFNWAFSGYLDTSGAQLVPNEDMRRMSRLYGHRGGAPGYTWLDALSDDNTLTTELDALTAIDAAGYLEDSSSVRQAWLLARLDDATLAAGDNDLFTGALAQVVDLKASASRTVRLIAHVHSTHTTGFTCSLWSASTRGGTYAHVTGGDATVSALTTPTAVDGASVTTAINRYAGVRIAVAAMTPGVTASLVLAVG